jgi:hypothetical protein
MVKIQTLKVIIGDLYEIKKNNQFAYNSSDVVWFGIRKYTWY